MKKYELTSETKVWFGRTLFRIKAVTSFGDVTAGDLGGFIEKESNLNQDGNAWVFGNAKVFGNAWVYGNARVYGNAKVYGNARVCSSAEVCGSATVCGDADYISIKGLGSEFRITTAFKDKKRGIAVSCGCFFGSLSEFKDKVKETHGDNKFAKEYLALIRLIEIHFDVKAEDIQNDV